MKIILVHPHNRSFFLVENDVAPGADTVAEIFDNRFLLQYPLEKSALFFLDLPRCTPQPLQNTEEYIIISSESVNGTVSINEPSVEIKTLENTLQNLLINYTSHNDNPNKEHLVKIRNFWTNSDNYDFVYPEKEGCWPKKGQDPFGFDQEKVFSIDNIKNVNWCKSYFINKKGNSFNVRNFKINQALPYNVDSPYDYALQCNYSDKKSIYIGGYPEPFIEFGKDWILYLRICADVDLGPSLSDIKKIKNFQGKNKIFVIQSNSITPASLFNCSGSGRNIFRNGIDENKQCKNQAQENVVFYNKQYMGYIYWPSSFTIDCNKDIYQAPSDEKEREKALDYLSFLSKFGYIVFADANGRSVSDGVMTNLSPEARKSDKCSMIFEEDLKNGVKMSIGDFCGKYNKGNTLEEYQLPDKFKNKDLAKCSIISCPKKVGNIYKIECDDNDKPSKLTFTQVNPIQQEYGDNIDYNTYEIS